MIGLGVELEAEEVNVEVLRRHQGSGERGRAINPIRIAYLDKTWYHIFRIPEETKQAAPHLLQTRVKIRKALEEKLEHKQYVSE